MSYSEPVQRAYDIYARYRHNRPPRLKSGRLSVIDARHRNMVHTWSAAGRGLYFHVWACLDCKFGYVHDLLPDHDDVDDARTLGIIRKRDWPRDCPVVLKEIAEAGEQARLELKATE